MGLDKEVQTLFQDVREQAEEMREELVSFRRELHRYPEVGFNLEHTASLVERVLGAGGISSRRCAASGVAAFVEGELPGPVTAFRADMDALSMDDAKDVPYRSMVPGKMHAAGHDAHTAILLGTGLLLQKMRPRLRGTAVLLFEPAEETEGGALPMIRDGALENPAPESIVGFRVSPELPAGHIEVPRGKVYAAADMFDIHIRGEGCHGASPHKGRDALAAGASLVGILQQGANRVVNPVEPVVLSVGTFNAGEARNAVAREAFLSGILRTLDFDVREKLREWLVGTVEQVCRGLGVEGSVRLRESYPSLENHPVMVRYLREVGELFPGLDRFSFPGRGPSMEVDDFSYFAQCLPGAFFVLGTGNPDKNASAPLHSPLFDIDEDSLPVGAAFNAALALGAEQFGLKEALEKK